MPSLSLPIQTERLTLRLFEERDLEDIHAIDSDPRVATYLYREVRDREQTRQALEMKREQTDASTDGSVLRLAIERQGQVIGEMMLRCLSQEHRQGEIGFVVGTAHQGRGYAAEAGRATLELGFSSFAFHRIIGRCDARNTASYQLMERLGMRREAHFVENELIKGEWTDELIYAMLAGEWPAR